MDFVVHDLGRQRRGAVAVVTLSGNAANVRLLDAQNYRNYKSGRRHSGVGGLAKRSPVRLAIPHDGHWYVVVDTAGLRGRVRSGVRTELPPLPVLRTSSMSESLNRISENVPVGLHGSAEAKEWDVFISHASEDKAAVARPLAERLRDLGLKVWLDDFELRIGDSLRRKLDAGLAGSRFGVIVLSTAFFRKGWAQYELDGLVTLQNSGRQTLLPLWHEISKDEVTARSPSLADKIARSTAQFTIEEIASEIAGVVRLAPIDDKDDQRRSA